MSKAKTESIVGTKLQDAVRKLIAEEYYAYTLYFLSRFAVAPNERDVVSDLFSQIADDELDDHMKTLTEWCFEYGIDVPCTESEFKKLAGAKASKQVSDLKKGKDAAYYIQEAVKSEEMAIESYKAVLDMKEVHDFTDLQSALWKIYYDEEEHLGNLKTARIAYDAGNSLIMN